VTWYTGGLPEATGVRLRLPNSHALLGVGRSWKTLLWIQSVPQHCSSKMWIFTPLHNSTAVRAS